MTFHHVFIYLFILSLHFVPSQHFVPGLQSAVYIIFVLTASSLLTKINKKNKTKQNKP